jgi:hypothetical protein
MPEALNCSRFSYFLETRIISKQKFHGGTARDIVILAEFFGNMCCHLAERFKASSTQDDFMVGAPVMPDRTQVGETMCVRNNAAAVEHQPRI